MGKGILVVSSTELSLDNGRSIYGIAFDYQSTDILHNKFDGVLKINPLRKVHKSYDVEFTPSFQYTGGYGTHDYDYRTGWVGEPKMTELVDDVPTPHKKKRGKKARELEMEREVLKDIENNVRAFGGRGMYDDSERIDGEMEGLPQRETHEIPLFRGV